LLISCTCILINFSIRNLHRGKVVLPDKLETFIRNEYSVLLTHLDLISSKSTPSRFIFSRSITTLRKFEPLLSQESPFITFSLLNTYFWSYTHINIHTCFQIHNVIFNKRGCVINGVNRYDIQQDWINARSVNFLAFLIFLYRNVW